MKNKIIFFILILLMISSVHSNETKETTVSLTIEITNIRTDQGNIRVHLYEIGNKEAFPDKSTKANQLKVTNIHMENKNNFQFLIEL